MRKRLMCRALLTYRAAPSIERHISSAAGAEAGQEVGTGQARATSDHISSRLNAARLIASKRIFVAAPKTTARVSARAASVKIHLFYQALQDDDHTSTAAGKQARRTAALLVAARRTPGSAASAGDPGQLCACAERTGCCALCGLLTPHAF
eukprot:1825840-Pleurochrysis_carterae.AAC.4